MVLLPHVDEVALLAVVLVEALVVAPLVADLGVVRLVVVEVTVVLVVVAVVVAVARVEEDLLVVALLVALQVDRLPWAKLWPRPASLLWSLLLLPLLPPTSPPNRLPLLTSPTALKHPRSKLRMWSTNQKTLVSATSI